MQEIEKQIKADPTVNNLFLGLKEQVDKLYRHMRQGSYRTRARYYYAMLPFCKFLAVVYRLEKLANLSAKHLCAYIELRQDDGISPATIKSELSGIRFFHDQIADARYRIPDNESLAVDLERRRFKDSDRTWSEQEYLDFVALAKQVGRPDFAGELILAHDLGLRIHETFRIDTAMAHAALAEDELTIKGKGGKVRTVSLTTAARNVLEERLAVTPRGGKLFVPRDQMTHAAIWELEQFVREHRNEIRDPNNPVAMTYHGLRHTFASNTYKRMIELGCTAFEAHIGVSRLLGHERADVTDIYLVGSKEGYDNMVR